MGIKRLIYVDYGKGIAILLMLMQHSIPQHNLFRQLTQAFVMPFFFVVGGYLWSYKQESGKEIGISNEYLIKRGKQLGIPYFTAGIALILFYEILSIISGTHSIISNFIRLITFQGIDSLWFLPVFFLSEIIFLFTLKFKPKEYLLVFDLIILITLVLWSHVAPSRWPFALINKALMGYLFFSGGYLVSNLYREVFKRSYTLLFLLLCILGLIGSYFNGFSSFANMNFPLLFYVNGLLLSIVILAVCNYYYSSGSGYSKVLTFFGRETLFILCTNNLIIESVRLLDHMVFSSFMLNCGWLGNILMFVVITIIEVLLILTYRSLRRYLCSSIKAN